MIATVVGFERVEFPSSDGSGKVIAGTRLYVTYESDLIKGIGADLKYFPDDGPVKLPEIVIGRKYDFNYQQKGFTGKNILVGVKPV